MCSSASDLPTIGSSLLVSSSNLDLFSLSLLIVVRSPRVRDPARGLGGKAELGGQVRRGELRLRRVRQASSA